MLTKTLVASLCLGLLPLRVRAQSGTAASATGTYASGTRRQPSSGRDGCWLETAPVAADSLRVQVRCSMGITHHLGVIDERLRFRDGRVVYATNRFQGTCRIVVRFTAKRAVVTQDGGDQACGFGAFVNVSGTYRRISRARPPFGLAPIERPRPHNQG